MPFHFFNLIVIYVHINPNANNSSINMVPRAGQTVHIPNAIRWNSLAGLNTGPHNYLTTESNNFMGHL